MRISGNGVHKKQNEGLHLNINPSNSSKKVRLIGCDHTSTFSMEISDQVLPWKPTHYCSHQTRFKDKIQDNQYNWQLDFLV
jgi:hypothetical protein